MFAACIGKKSKKQPNKAKKIFFLVNDFLFETILATIHNLENTVRNNTFL